MISKTYIFDQRSEAPVSLFTGCYGNDKPTYSTIGEVLKRIKEEDPTLKEIGQRLFALAESDPNKYKEAKEKECPAFIIGKYGSRKNNDCQEYVPLLAFDVDHCDYVAVVAQRIKQISKSPYIYGAYMSPSGKGFRFLVWCDSTPDNHKRYYQAICKYFSKFLDIPTDKALRDEYKKAGLKPDEINSKLKDSELIDTGTNNLARLWFYTAVPDDCIYLNEESQVFYLKNAHQEGEGVAHGRGGQQISEEKKIELCLNKVKRQNIPTGRNNFVFALAAEFARHGISQARALVECLQYQEKDFGESEIKKSVVSAYQSKGQEFTDRQIRKYKKMVEGATDHPDAKSSRPAKIESGDYQNKPKFVKIRDYIDTRYDLRLNVIANEIEVSPKGRNTFKELNVFDLMCELLEKGFTAVETPLMALVRSSYVEEYDPFVEYFESLPGWKEGDPDYITELANYIEAYDQFWFNLQFKKMLVRTVACALKVIPFNKQCLVLKGGQNDGKTTFVRFLCPPRLKNYITEQINFHNKDGNIALCQNFIINLDELSKIPAKEVNKVKSMITIDHVKERMPYGKNPVRIPRRASFFGSTNDDEFLTDSTGNVRWLIMEIKKNGVKHDNGGPKGYTVINMDLVYSQAYALLNSGFEYELSKKEIQKSEKNNQGFQIISVEQELIQENFAPGKEGEEGTEFVTATDIMKTIEGEVKTTLHTRTIGKAMRLLGFEKVQKHFTELGYQKKGYWIKRLNPEE